MSTTYFGQSKPLREAMPRRYSTFLPTGLANRISLIQAMKPDPGSTSLRRSRKRPGSSRAGAILAKAPPPLVIHVRLAQRLRGRAWLARQLYLFLITCQQYQYSTMTVWQPEGNVVLQRGFCLTRLQGFLSDATSVYELSLRCQK